MSAWIKMTEVTPRTKQAVWYFHPDCGVWQGTYHGRGEYGHEFSSRGGFLSGGVTHWMPDTKQEERPTRPTDAPEPWDGQ